MKNLQKATIVSIGLPVLSIILAGCYVAQYLYSIQEKNTIVEDAVA